MRAAGKFRSFAFEKSLPINPVPFDRFSRSVPRPPKRGPRPSRCFSPCQRTRSCGDRRNIAQTETGCDLFVRARVCRGGGSGGCGCRAEAGSLPCACRARAGRMPGRHRPGTAGLPAETGVAMRRRGPAKCTRGVPLERAPEAKLDPHSGSGAGSAPKKRPAAGGGARTLRVLRAFGRTDTGDGGAAPARMRIGAGGAAGPGSREDAKTRRREGAKGRALPVAERLFFEARAGGEAFGGVACGRAKLGPFASLRETFGLRCGRRPHSVHPKARRARRGRDHASRGDISLNADAGTVGEDGPAAACRARTLRVLRAFG